MILQFGLGNQLGTVIRYACGYTQRAWNLPVIESGVDCSQRAGGFLGVESWAIHVTEALRNLLVSSPA